jgi:protein-disulfide isomerase
MPEDRYFAFIKTLFDSQAAWASSSDVDATLAQYAKLAGLPGERVTACMNNKVIQEALVKRRMEAEKQFKVEATPSFVVNYGVETFSGIGSFDDFEKKIQKYVDKKDTGKTSEKPAGKTEEKK